MLGANLFFKRPEMANRNGVMRSDDVNNSGARVSANHPRFGFKTMLNIDSEKALPTAPSIVGGNLDWTKAKVTPNTHFLRDALSRVRPMNPAPSLGTSLRLGEPNVNSIHTY